MMASSCSFAAACSTNGATSTQSIPGPGAMEDAGEGSAKGEKRDAIELKSGDRISYRNRGAVVQDDLRLKETQTRANPFSNWRDLPPGDERCGKIFENPEHFAWGFSRETGIYITGKGDGKKQHLEIDRNDGKGFVYLYPPRKKDPQDAKAPAPLSSQSAAEMPLQGEARDKDREEKVVGGAGPGELMLQSVSADREIIELFRKYEAVAVDTVSGIEAAYVGKAVSELGARRRNMERPANPPGFNNRFKHKTQLCRYWKAGNCSQGARCR